MATWPMKRRRLRRLALRDVGPALWTGKRRTRRNRSAYCNRNATAGAWPTGVSGLWPARQVRPKAYRKAAVIATGRWTNGKTDYFFASFAASFAAALAFIAASSAFAAASFDASAAWFAASFVAVPA